MTGSNQTPLVLVDDGADDQFLFKHLAVKAGVERELLVFDEGAEAIAYFQRLAAGGLPKPVACFIDIRMPGVNGFDVLQALRAEKSLDDICAVMFSTSERNADVHTALKLGAQCYLVKFPSEQTLAAVISAAERFASDRVSARDELLRLEANLL